MSVVYRAFDETLNQFVALKILNAQRAADPIAVRRFEREAQIAQRLQHPHIIKIYEYGEIGDLAYLSMEYIAEGSLGRRLSQPITLSLGTSAEYLNAIASALDYAHSKGVVHRDLKLENVLIDENGRLAISDFGIAQAMGVSSLTETGQTFGTPLYVSPEQLRGAKGVDYRTDLYSLGVIAYLLATGYFPFTGPSGIAILNHHLTSEPPLPSNLNPRLPPQMDWVLQKSLAKRPQDRFASAGALARAFEAAITHAETVEIVILASQPTPIISQIDNIVGKPGGEKSGADTVPINEMFDDAAPRRAAGTGSPRSLRVILGVLVLALVSIVLLGLGTVFAPPDEVATQSATPNSVLLATQPTPTATATVVTSTPVPTETEPPSLTPTLPPTTLAPTTPAPTVTRNSPTPLALVISTATATRTPTRVSSAVPTHVSTATSTRTASPSATRRATATTSAPATQVATSAAPTSAPATQAPPTSAPPTQVPATQIPPTSVPPTQVPPTSVPPTSVPPTSVPPTQVPPTSIIEPLIPPVVPTLLCGLLCGG